MKTNDRITLNNILLHKDHFDSRLIDICQNLTVKNDVLTISNANLKKQLLKNKKKISVLELKNKDLKIQNYNNEQKYLEANKEKDDLLEYIKNLKNELNEIKKENERQKKEIEKERQKIDKTVKENKEIIKKYKSIIKKLGGANSTNSNMPSSFDVLGRTKARAQANTRTKSEKKRGGQKNHPLHKSKLSERVDHIRILKVKKAPAGAVPVKNEEGMVKYYVTQEVDLTLKSTITETRYYIDERAEELEKDKADKYAINPVVYSGQFKAAVVYLNQRGTVPVQRLCAMIEDISKGSIRLRAGTISKWCEECYKKSEEERSRILKEILEGPLVHVDETGMKVSGKPYWIHTITNEKGAVFFMTKRRGDEERGAIGKLKEYRGIVMHDHFLSYLKLPCTHAECNAHIDRYLKSGIDFDKNEECEEMLELLHKMLGRKRELITCGEGWMTDEEIREYKARYEEILKRGLKNYYAKNPDIKKKYEPDYVKTFKRMLVYEEEHLRFITDFRVPYSNNAAEQQCRVVKTKKKTSTQFVSENGGESYVGILSLLQTAKIKNENALEALERVFH